MLWKYFLPSIGETAEQAVALTPWSWQYIYHAADAARVVAEQIHDRNPNWTDGVIGIVSPAPECEATMWDVHGEPVIEFTVYRMPQ